jgi:hypothetical protein
MTMRTKFPIVCECGHRGALLLSENDQPYSRCWETYSLEGFGIGANIQGTPNEEPLAQMNPVCPKCGKADMVSYENQKPYRV